MAVDDVADFKWQAAEARVMLHVHRPSGGRGCVCLWRPSKPQVCVSESRRQFGDPRRGRRIDAGSRDWRTVSTDWSLAGRKAREMEEDRVVLDDASGT